MKGLAAGELNSKQLSTNIKRLIEKILRNDYELGEVDGRILLELTITLDQFRTETSRQTTNILSMIGDVGGFTGAFTMFISVVGAFFSNLYFKASIIENFYIRALSS